jgi:hypothetical protein
MEVAYAAKKGPEIFWTSEHLGFQLPKYTAANLRSSKFQILSLHNLLSWLLFAYSKILQSKLRQ